jgi:hypothetical protein
LIGHVLPSVRQSWITPDKKKKKKSCIYVSMNLSGAVDIYKGHSPYTLIGSLAGGGWGVAADTRTVYVGSPSNVISFYHACNTATATGSVTGVSGDEPYGMDVAPSGNLYATAWPSSTIETWTAPVTNGEAAVTATEPNITEAYFIDVDASNAYIVGYNSSSVEELDQCTTAIASCTSAAQISGGFPGGVESLGGGNVVVNNQYGILTEYSGCPSACTSSGTYTYSNGTNPLDYTQIVANRADTSLWGANIYYCSSSYGLCGDGQSQTLPIGSGTALNGNTAAVSNDEALGITMVPKDGN